MSAPFAPHGKPQAKPTTGREPGCDDEPEAQPEPRFKFTPIAEIVNKHPGARTWHIRNYIPAGMVALFYGDPASGKTNIVIDICCSIAAGMEWCGIQPKQGKILYVAAEDFYGVRLRAEAWFARHKSNPDNMDILDIPIVLADENDVNELIAIINSMKVKPAVIVIDTLALSMGKFSENNDMQLFCNGATKVKLATGVTVVVIHHCGHGDKERSRGGSQLPGNADVIFQVKRKDDVCTLHCQKMKNGNERDAADLAWKMIPQATKWVDEDGQVIGSVVLEPTDLLLREPSNQQQIALDLLRQMVLEREETLVDSGHDPAGARVAMAEWLTAMESEIAAKSSRYKVRNDLIKHGLVKVNDLYVTPA